MRQQQDQRGCTGQVGAGGSGVDGTEPRDYAREGLGSVVGIRR